ncbi:MAG: indole-3-glycerol phosphate synthase TrpC [Candidatus Omnitrophota bacterium]
MAELNSYLEKILTAKRDKIETRRKFLENIRRNTEKAELTGYHYFRNNIKREGRVSLIAEIKRASPSKGIIREEFGVAQLARIYQQSGAAALSVLTEETFFLGRPDYVRIAADFNLPVLAKDFFIDELQIPEAFSYGAKAILLIMAVLDDEQVRRMLKVSARLDMDCLVEVHSEEELERALNCGAEIIGVNNRDLKTFEIDLDYGEKILRRIPQDRIMVIESGIQTHEDVLRFKEAGVHAVLIGETFMRSDDVGAKVRDVMGKLI